MTAPAPQPHPKLRWYQYRLRSLMLLMTLLSLGLAIWFTAIAPYRRQYEALQRLRTIKGQTSDNAGPYGPTADVEPALPGWLRKLPGSDRLVKVTRLSLDHCAVEAKLVNSRLTPAGEAKLRQFNADRRTR